MISVDQKTAVVEDYYARIRTAARSGFVEGHRQLNSILADVSVDPVLTDTDFIYIIRTCDMVHIKLMEDNYNGTWKQ